MSETASLLVEFKSIGRDVIVREAEETKQTLVKSAKESAAVFQQMFKERDALEAEWVQRLKEREAATIVMRKQAGESARAELAKTRSTERQLAAQQQAEFKQGLAIQLAQIKAAAVSELAEAKKIADAKKALQRDIIEGARRAAKESAAAQSEQGGGRGFRVALGAVAGQGLSIGGIASVNPMAAGAVAAAYAVKNVTSDLLAQATVWEKFKVALTDIEGSAQKAETATNDLYEMAKRPGISLKEAEQTYLQFRALEIEGPKAQKIIAAISNAVALSGGGAEEFGRVNLQITQMLSKGKVLEEDLRVMRNSMPRLTSAMREAFGTTTAEGIRKAGINAEQFLDKIVERFEKLPKATQTLESAQENAATAMSRLKAALVPDAAVKSGIESWTSLLEGLTEKVNALAHPVATTSSIWNDLKNTVAKASGISQTDLATAKAGAAKYGAEPANTSSIDAYLADPKNGFKRVNTSPKPSMGMSAYDILNISANEADRAKSKAEYDQAESNKVVAKNEESKALKAIELENAKLQAQLMSMNEYEKQRLVIIAEYGVKIEEAKDAEEKAGLTEQKRLQLAVLAKKHKEEEAKAIASTKAETEKLIRQQEDLDEFDRKRAQSEDEYKRKIEEANKLGNEGLATELARQKIFAKDLIDQEQALSVAKERAAIDKEFESATGVSWSDYQMLHPGSTESERGRSSDTTSSEAGNTSLTKARREEQAANAKSLSLQYLPEWDKLKAEYEKQRLLIVDATFKTGEERNRVMKALNDQYLRDQADMLTKQATAVTSAGQSLFGDIASSMKMRTDYQYTMEKSAVEKRYSLAGLEGNARKAQQQKLNDALAALDEKRQSDMSGAYLTMFMIAKGFALAESALKLNLAIVNAAASGPFPENLVAMAAVAAAVGGVISNIAAIQYAGAFDKGGDIPAGKFGMVGENGLEFVQGPARVTSTKDTAKMLAGAGRAPVVNVHNYSGQNVQVNQGEDENSIDILIGEIAKKVESQLSTGVRSGRGDLGSAVKETFGLTRRGY